MITSQLPIKEGHDWLGDSTLTDATLDRLVHNSYKLELKDSSKRKTHTNQQTLHLASLHSVFDTCNGCPRRIDLGIRDGCSARRVGCVLQEQLFLRMVTYGTPYQKTISREGPSPLQRSELRR